MSLNHINMFFRTHTHHGRIYPGGLVAFALMVAFVGGCQKVSPQRFVDPLPLSFGVLADVQYCDCDTHGSRHYRGSLAKLESCVEQLNRQKLTFVIQLGDLIDRDVSSYEPVLRRWSKIKTSSYHVLGNHDFSVTDYEKSSVLQKLDLDRGYYQFNYGRWRFMVLDGNDISLYAHRSESQAYNQADQIYQEMKRKGLPQAQSWNGGLGQAQLEWLDGILTDADQAVERVILFCHFPVYPPDVHNLWNDTDVIAILERHPCVAAYLNGHNHAGHYAEKNGIHYLTLQGLVETANTHSFAVVTFGLDHLEITGYGREPSRKLQFRTSPQTLKHSNTHTLRPAYCIIMTYRL